MPSSLIFTGLVVLWLLILVPAVARHQQEVARPSGASLAGRVLDRPRRRIQARRTGRLPTEEGDSVDPERLDQDDTPTAREPERPWVSAARAARLDEAAAARRARRRRRARSRLRAGRRGLRRRRVGRPLGTATAPLPARPRRVRPRGRRGDRPRPVRLPPARGAAPAGVRAAHRDRRRGCVPRGVVGPRRDRPRAGGLPGLPAPPGPAGGGDPRAPGRPHGRHPADPGGRRPRSRRVGPTRPRGHAASGPAPRTTPIVREPTADEAEVAEVADTWADEDDDATRVRGRRRARRPAARPAARRRRRERRAGERPASAAAGPAAADPAGDVAWSWWTTTSSTCTTSAPRPGRPTGRAVGE